VFGDHGRIDQAAGTLRLLTTGNVTRIESREAGNGADDLIYGELGNDRLLGGKGADVISAGSGNNIVLGDDGLIDYVVYDANRSDIDLIQSSSTTAYGGRRHDHEHERQRHRHRRSRGRHDRRGRGQQTLSSATAARSSLRPRTHRRSPGSRSRSAGSGRSSWRRRRGLDHDR
jgi:Ca2+-binding RTX toxin-like protein